jgi:hypothetical protein
MLNRLSRLRVSQPSRALNFRSLPLRTITKQFKTHDTALEHEDPTDFFKAKIDKKSNLGVSLAESITANTASNKYERDQRYEIFINKM